MNHLWQRFLLASSLVVGLLIGVAATVFGYDNRTSVDVYWLIFHIHGVPVWTVAVVPLAFFLVAGYLYHWINGLHHFTEHMRHRRRVHELEAEVASLRARLDQMLEMPDHSTSKRPDQKASTASQPAADASIVDLGSTEAERPPARTAPPAEAPQIPAPSTVDGIAHAEATTARKSRSPHRKRVTLEVPGEPRRPDRSAPHAEGAIVDGNASASGDHLEPEA